MKLEKRLEQAIRKMRKSEKYKAQPSRKTGKPRSPFDEIREMALDRAAGLGGFYARVDWAKEILRRSPKLGSLKRPQVFTPLRAELEDHHRDLGYFGEPHLAVALVELGYFVGFLDSSYFETDFPSQAAWKALRKQRQQHGLS